MSIQPSSPQKTLTIPAEAVLYRGQKAYVYRVVDQIAQQTEITRGAAMDDHVQVLSGLNPNDQVVVQGQHQLQSGQVVRTLTHSS
ncbi:hypothetical protein IPJ72_06665 [Candidatus Peregrinibacteria bacterium]|nr:MAG: hypothetical protein IPJ72_06665 [Candidatus Peregrinibacteria bacterium]